MTRPDRHEMDDEEPGWDTSEPTAEQVRAAWLVLLCSLLGIGLLLYFGFTGYLHGT